MMHLIYRWYWDARARMRLGEDSGTAFVVLGFRRSGTSLVARLVYRSGVYFGEPEDAHKEPDQDNPYGFFEHVNFTDFERRFLQQSGNRRSARVFGHQLLANTLIHKVERGIDTLRLLRFLHDYSAGRERWGFKATPGGFHFFRPFLPKIKIIGVFRDPFAATHSSMKVGNAGVTFVDELQNWVNVNKELLYWLTVNDSVLVRYSDLLDEEKQPRILAQLTEFIGCGDPKDLAPLINPRLNRSLHEVESLRERFPLSEEAKAVFASLEHLKLQ